MRRTAPRPGPLLARVLAGVVVAVITGASLGLAPGVAGAAPFWRPAATAPETTRLEDLLALARQAWMAADEAERIAAAAAAAGHRDVARAKREEALELKASVSEAARRALEELERRIARHPGDVALRRLAVVASFRYAQDYAAAVRHIDALRELQPDDPAAQSLTEDLGHALAKLAQQGGPDADAHLRRAVAEYDRWFAVANPTDPYAAATMATTHANVAELHMALGDLERAIGHYRLATGPMMGESLPHYGLAVAYDRDGQHERALESMAAALAADPEMGRILSADEPYSGVYFVPAGDKWYYIALAREARGEWQEAISALNTFLAVCRHARPEYKQLARRRIAELGRRPAPKAAPAPGAPGPRKGRRGR